ncbi:MAG: hypothetical protein B6229_01965 [Spirochaetaceae bacterium 4572_7]|nr:MAG: hypothetical protein B6229_01965 [Spirochaetaceae bacterium 4572_7]
MKKILLLLFITMTTLLSSESFSMEKLLATTTFHYSTDTDGDYVIDYKTRTGRDQQIIVRKHTNAFQNIYVREIISIAKVYTNEIIPEKLTKYLLIDNYSSKYIGNWAIHKKDDISTILFIAKLPYDTERLFLEAAVVEVAEAADALEKAMEEE